MKQVLIAGAAIVVIFLFLARTKVSMNHFKIEFESLLSAIGLVLVMIGIACIEFHHEKVGYKKGLDYSIKEMKDKTISIEAENDLIKIQKDKKNEITEKD